MSVSYDPDDPLEWLKAQHQEVIVAYAARNALRAMPNIADAPDATLGGIALPVVRAIIISAVAGKMPTAEMKFSAARSARSAAFSARSADSAASAARSAADSAARSAARSARSADSARSAAFSAAFSAARSARSAAFSAAFSAAKVDATTALSTSDPMSVFALPLWPNSAMPKGVAENLEDLRRFFADDPKTWGFWTRWYDGFLTGKPLDWALQERIALIPDEEWEAGPARIAELIRRLQFQSLTQIAPPLLRGNNDTAFHIATDDPVPADVLDFARQRISMALANALAAAKGNGLTETSGETFAIRSALAERPATGSLLATAFFDACLSLDANIGDIYPPDASLINLKNALYAVVEEICEIDETAKDRCARLSSLHLAKYPSPVEKANAAELAEVVTAFTDDHATDVIKSDAQSIVAETASRRVRARFANYVTTVTIWMDKTMKGQKRTEWAIETLDKIIKYFMGDGA